MVKHELELYSLAKLHDFWEENALLRSLESPDMPIIVYISKENLLNESLIDKETMKMLMLTTSQILVFMESCG